MEDFVSSYLRWAMGLPDSLPPYGFYHYTSYETLLAMLGSGTMRASCADFLNDYSELRYAASIMRAHVDRWYAMEPDEEVAKLFRAIQDRMRGPMKLEEFFILSFTDNGSDYGMWNLYSKRGTGLSFSFPGGKAYEWAQNNNGVLVRVFYEPDELDVFCRTWLAKVREAFVGSRSREEEPDPEGFAKAFLRDVGFYAPVFKPKVWSDEREWRYVFRRNEGVCCDVGGRRYIEIPKPPIDAVCLGPKNPLSQEQAEEQLRAAGFEGRVFRAHVQPPAIPHPPPEHHIRPDGGFSPPPRGPA